MSANNSIVLSLCDSLAAYLAGNPVTSFAASIHGPASSLIADEERFEIPGQFVRLPAILVQAESASATTLQDPVFMVPVRIVIRDGLDAVNSAAHQEHAITVADVLWDFAALEAWFASSAPTLNVSGWSSGSETFQISGRYYETVLAFEFEASSKTTP